MLIFGRTFVLVSRRTYIGGLIFGILWYVYLYMFFTITRDLLTWNSGIGKNFDCQCRLCLHSSNMIFGHSVFPLSKGGDPNFENFKKGETWKKIWGGETKSLGGIFKMKLFKLNLWIKKSKNGDFQWQISINFLK